MPHLKAAAAAAFSLTLLASTLLSACSETQAEAAPPPPPTVSVAEVPFKTLNDWYDYTGRIEAVQQVELRPRVSGYIESVHFTEGAIVNKGQLLFQIDQRPFAAEVQRLKALAVRAEAQAKLAEANRARSESLIGQGAISAEEHDRLTATAEAAQADVGATRAALSAAALNLSFTRVTAPVTGRVSRALITTGNLVTGASLLTTLVSVDPVYVSFDVDEETYLAALSHDEPAKVFVGRVNDEGTPREAKLDFVDNASHAGVIRVRATLNNQDNAFTPGLFARVKLVAGGSFEAALVDDRAIGTDLGKKFVLAVGQDNVAEYRSVRTGALVDGLRVIREGLLPGDRVVVNGLQRVRPGTPVTPETVAMEGNGRSLVQVSAAPSKGAVSAAVARAAK
jgi:membrane fusion protein, multidrug efflux system